MAARLRAERKRAGFTQKEFASIGGVGLGSQNRYESGDTDPGASYLARLAESGIDVLWVLTASRNVGELRPEQSSLLDAFNDLRPLDRAVLLRLAASLADRPPAPDLVALPSTRALTAALQAFLETTPGLAGDELVHELATQLPTILRAAEDELPAPSSAPRADSREAEAADATEPRATRRGQRS